MKNYKLLFTLFVLIYSINSVAQDIEPIELTINGYEPVVFIIENQNQSELYKLTNKWIIKNYKNPKEVVTADVENENINISGYAENIVRWGSTGGGFGLKYILQIEFKENKYRVTILPEIDSPALSYASFFKKDGQKKTGYKGGPESIDNYINSLLENLNNFIKNKGKEEDTEW